MRVLVLLVALAGPILSQDIDNEGRYFSDDSGRYVPDNSGRYVRDTSGEYLHDNSGNYVHQPGPNGPDGPDYRAEAATREEISILPIENFLIPNPPLNPRTYLPPVSSGPIRQQALPPLELPLLPASPTRNTITLNTPVTHLPLISNVDTPLSSRNSFPLGGSRNPPAQIPSFSSPAVSPGRPPFGTQLIGRRPSTPVSSPSGAGGVHGGPPFGSQLGGGRPSIQIPSPSGAGAFPGGPPFGSQSTGGRPGTQTSLPSGAGGIPGRQPSSIQPSGRKPSIQISSPSGAGAVPGGPPFGSQLSGGRPSIQISSPSGAGAISGGSPFGAQSNGGRPSIQNSFTTGLDTIPRRPSFGSQISGRPNLPIPSSLTIGSRRPAIPSQSNGRLTTGLGGNRPPPRTITISGPPPAEIGASVNRPGITGGGPYIWEYDSTGPHVVDVSDPYHKYRVHFGL